MNGYQAFDALVTAGLMVVDNPQVGWGRICLNPQSRSKRDRIRDLGLIVRCVSLMTAFDNQIERSRSSEPDLLLFRKWKR